MPDSIRRAVRRARPLLVGLVLAACAARADAADAAHAADVAGELAEVVVTSS
ncbi:MAG: hypothetical protein JSR54_15505, partial [Proteobacteria bacterium]|nr:hypothetical protein [Pseudomonadota bacterium]